MRFITSLRTIRIKEVYKLAEILIGAAVFAILGILLTKNAGGPVTSDEVMYINHGLLNIKDPFIINRYTHIYFQKLFMELADQPYEGVKAYWGFLVASSAALTYVISRLVTRSSNIVHAVISTLFYLTIPLLVEYSGNTAVDITAGFFLGLTVLLFMLYFRLPGKPEYFLILMGLTFFLAFRSKETTLASVVLLIGFLYNDEGKIDHRLFFRRLGYFLFGTLAGIVFFIVLNGIFLKDPWFGLKLNEYFQFKESYIDRNIGEESKAIANWFTDFFLVSTPYIFLAYLFSGIKILREQAKPMRLPWLIPLVLIAILSMIIGFSSWGVVPRHIFPILPLICAFAPQLMVFEPTKTRKDILWLGFSFIVTAILLVVGRKLLVQISLSGPYYYPDFLASTIYPITLIALIIQVFLIKRYSLKLLFLPLLVFAIFIMYPLYYNTISFFIVQTNVRKMDERLQVVEVFEGKVGASDKKNILVFDGSLSYLNYSSRDIEFIDLYNMFFDARLTSKEVTMTSMETFSPELITEWQPAFIIMSAEEFSSHEANTIITSYISREYALFESRNGRFVLFSRLE